MFCTNCGKELKPEARFCGRCGTPTSEPATSTAAPSYTSITASPQPAPAAAVVSNKVPSKFTRFWKELSKRNRILLLCAVAVILIAAILGISIHRSGPSGYHSEFENGLRFLNAGSYEEAILAFSTAIEIDPKQAGAYEGRGDAYTELAAALDAEDDWNLLLANYQRAEEDYLKAIQLDASNADLYHKLADVYLAMGDPEKAAAILEKGYRNTGDESLNERAETVNILPTELPTGSVIVSMYEESGDFLGHDAYSFDMQGRMTSNTWYDTQNNIVFSQTWEYDDEQGITISTVHDQQTDGGSYDVNTETIDGCEDQGWYWDSMSDFSTDPTLDAVNGIVSTDTNARIEYGYDLRGRVNTIHTYDDNNSLLGYCTVSYAN